MSDSGKTQAVRQLLGLGPDHDTGHLLGPRHRSLHRERTDELLASFTAGPTRLSGPWGSVALPEWDRAVALIREASREQREETARLLAGKPPLPLGTTARKAATEAVERLARRVEDLLHEQGRGTGLEHVYGGSGLDEARTTPEEGTS